eukprot:80308-Prymnesium_polylepis.1
MRVSAPFWRDLRWWRSHLVHRSLAAFEREPMGEDVLTGTDASGRGNWSDSLVGWGSRGVTPSVHDGRKAAAHQLERAVG